MQRHRLSVPEDGAPAVVAGREAFAKRHRDDRRTEIAGHALGRLPITRHVEHRAGDVRTFNRNAEDGLEVLFVGDDDVHAAHQRLHRRLCLRLGPQLPAEVQVDADASPCLLRGRHSCAGRRRRARTECRRDTGDMEPGGGPHDVVPVEGVCRELADRRVCTIINYGRRPLAGAGFGEVDAEALAGSHDPRRVDPLRP